MKPNENIFNHKNEKNSVMSSIKPKIFVLPPQYQDLSA